MSRSYFEAGNLFTRFLCYFGNTTDLFVDDTLYPQDIEYALHRKLKANGYERIVFYGYARGAYFLDEQSKQLWHGRKENAVKKQSGSLFAGQRMLKGRLRPQAASGAAERKGALAYTVDAAQMLRTTEFFVKDTDIKTAVIFPDGVGVLKDFSALDQGKLLDQFFVSVTKGHVDQLQNANVAIFLFNRSREQVMELLGDRAKESMKNYLLDPSYATSHQIPLPNKKELRRMLNYLRIFGNGREQLKVDCGSLEAISDMLSRKLAANRSEQEPGKIYLQDQLQAYDLKGTMTYLMNRFLIPGRKLDLEACCAICRRGDDVPAIEQLNGLIGMQSVKRAVQGFLNLHQTMEKREPPQAASRLDRPEALPEKSQVNLHFALLGNQGVGKTTAAKLIGEILCEYGFLPTGHTVMTTPAELKGDHVGESEKNILAAVERAMGGVLFIDEAYELADETASGIVTQLVASMTAYQGQFSVILAGYPGSMEKLMNSNAGLKSRLEQNWVVIDNYEPGELVEIFYMMVNKEKLAVSKELEELLPSFIRNWYYDKRNVDWANAREMENLLGEMKKQCRGRVLEPAMIPAVLQQYTTAKAEEDAIQELENLIGLKTVKEEIGKLRRQSKYKNQDMPRHYIFAGPPGTGKTTVAKLLGKILKNMGVLENGHLVETRPDELIADHVGGSAPKARAVFDTALDGVLFIDEAYGLVPTSRMGGKEKDFGGMVIDLLLKYTDPGNKKPMSFICAGYEADMAEFLKYNDGLSRRFTVLHFESYTVDELMRILEFKLEKRGYTAEEAYMEIACQKFKEEIDVIQRRYNGGYIDRYITASEDQLFMRLDEQYGDAEVPKEELHILRGVDAPGSQEDNR